MFDLVAAIRTVLDASEHEVTFDLLKKIDELRGALDDITDRVERQYPDSEAPGTSRARSGSFSDGAAHPHELTTGR